jgi:hypothetical protein
MALLWQLRRFRPAAIKAAPLSGHVAAAPADGCAEVIDPDPVSGS